MIKIITSEKPLKKVINLNEEYQNSNYEEKTKEIVNNAIDFLIQENGIFFLKFYRKNFYIKAVRDLMIRMKKLISNYQLTNQPKNTELIIVAGLPKNKKVKDENIFEPYKKPETYNIVSFYLALKGKNIDYEGYSKYDFSYTDREELRINDNIVRVKGDDNPDVKNAGQVASYIIRSLIKDGCIPSMHYVIDKRNVGVEAKAYQTLIILDRMSKESQESICGGFDKVPKEFQNNKIKIFTELPEVVFENSYNLFVNNKDENTQNEHDKENENLNSASISEVAKIEFHLAYKNF